MISISLWLSKIGILYRYITILLFWINVNFAQWSWSWQFRCANLAVCRTFCSFLYKYIVMFNQPNAPLSKKIQIWSPRDTPVKGGIVIFRSSLFFNTWLNLDKSWNLHWVTLKSWVYDSRKPEKRIFFSRIR